MTAEDGDEGLAAAFAAADAHYTARDKKRAFEQGARNDNSISTLRRRRIAADAARGVRLLPSDRHVCSAACALEPLKDDPRAPVFYCPVTGKAHVCGLECTYTSLTDPVSHASSCPVTGVQIDDPVLAAGWGTGEPIEGALDSRATTRASARMSRCASALQTELLGVAQRGTPAAPGVPRMVGLGVSTYAWTMFCNGGGAATERSLVPPMPPARTRGRDPVLAAVASNRKSIATVVLLRLLTGERRAALEERKATNWTNEVRKALTRYVHGRRGRSLCIAEILNVACAIPRKPGGDGVLVTVPDAERIVAAYAAGFDGFMTRLCELAGRDVTDGRVTQEHCVAYFYMLHDGLQHGGMVLVPIDLNMLSWLPDAGSLDNWGISMGGCTNARTLFWSVIRTFLCNGGAVARVTFAPVEVPPGAAADSTVFM